MIRLDCVEVVRDFYKNNIPILPPKSKWRQFKYFTWEGEMKVLRHRITSAEELQKHLIDLAPRDVYLTASRWMDPTKLGPKRHSGKKEGYDGADSCFYGSDYVVDIDNHHQVPQTIDASYNTLVSAYRVLTKKFGFEDFRFIKSGNGFQMWVMDFEKKVVDNPLSNPYARLNFFYQKKKFITDYIISDGDIKNMQKYSMIYDKNGKFVRNTCKIKIHQP